MNTVHNNTRGKLQVGLTGGVGSGKTAVSNRFNQLGITVIDTDVISRQLTEPNGLAIDPIRVYFGPQAINQDNALNRHYMRQLILNNTSHRKILESILHPLIRTHVQEQLKQVLSPYVLIVIPLLAENPEWLKQLDEIVVIDCDEALQIQRVMLRNQWPKQQIQQMIAVQASRQARLQIATEVLTNNADLDNLYSQIDVLHQKFLQNASKLRK